MTTTLRSVRHAACVVLVLGLVTSCSSETPADDADRKPPAPGVAAAASPPATAAPAVETVPASAALPQGWYAATDEATGKEYYYTAAGAVSWERPTSPA